jgi:hypothetical protein
MYWLAKPCSPLAWAFALGASVIEKIAQNAMVETTHKTTVMGIFRLLSGTGAESSYPAGSAGGVFFFFFSYL